jgi:hypothetical protein
MSYSLWDQIGANLNELRLAGVTVPVADVIVCTLGIDHDVEVWSRDAQFKLVQGVIPKLRLFQEPP